MKKGMNKFLYWSPRVLSIVFVLFLMLFSLDVFENNYGFWGTLLGLFMHNIPALVLLAVTIISWKGYEIVGGVVFIIAGLLYIFLTLFRGQIPWYIALSWSMIIAVPALLTGALYLWNWFGKREVVVQTKTFEKNQPQSSRTDNSQV